MDNNIVEIEDLIKQFSKLPGLGPKSAKRIILKLINNKDSMIKPLAKSLANTYKKVVRCKICGNLKVLEQICTCETKSNYEKICGRSAEIQGDWYKSAKMANRKKKY